MFLHDAARIKSLLPETKASLCDLVHLQKDFLMTQVIYFMIFNRQFSFSNWNSGSAVAMLHVTHSNRCARKNT